MQTSIETTATVQADRRLLLDDAIPAPISMRVRVIVLIDEDVDEREWTTSAALNDVYEFLADDREDIYSTADGAPISDET